MTQLEPIVVIGAGVGGLTTAALLTKAGCDVTVLEAHVYPGGCAGTFFHKNYRFEAGATLAGGFYPGGPMDIVAQALDIESWPAHADEPAMVVHLPDGQSIARYGDERRWQEYRRAFGEAGEAFWRWQEGCADALWSLALRAPDWPPQSLKEAASLAKEGLAWLAADPTRRLRPQLLADAFRPVAAHLQEAPKALRLFVDAQLLIAAQTTSAYANAFYGAAALDLPRRGVVHLKGGIGAIAETLVDAVRRYGGKVLLRQEVERIVYDNGQPIAVETKRGERFPARTVIVNLPPWNIARLTGDHALKALRRLPENPEPGWGAFCRLRGIEFTEADRAEIDEQVRRAAYVIIEGKGATYYGIGSALARIVESVIEDQRSILTVCAPTEEVAGVRNVTVALPRLVGGDGVLATFPQLLSPEEEAALQRSASIVREAITSLGL